MNQTTLLLGDCLEKLKELPDNSIDSIVTDPPYGLGKEPDALEMLKDWLETGHHEVKGKGFMGKEWDAFVPQPQEWRECLRVLKPGGHLLAFAGTRTQDLMCLGLRLAGFEIRDMVAWVYGSGFPKSMSIPKAIDKVAGKEGTYGEPKSAAHAGWIDRGRMRGEEGHEGYQRPWMDDPESVDKNARQYIGGTDEAKQWGGWGTALKPALEPITLARKPLDGTVAANVLKWHTGGLNIDACRIPTNPDVDDARLGGNGTWSSEKMAKNVYEGGYAGERVGSSSLGRFPANLIHDGSDEVVALFPETSSGKMKQHIDGGSFNVFGKQYPRNVETIGDSGSAARFFYCAKTSKKDRNDGLDNMKLVVLELQSCESDLTQQDQSVTLLVDMEALLLKATGEFGTSLKNGNEWSTVLFGNRFTGQFQMECKSTTSTATSSTIESKILSALQHSITSDCIPVANSGMESGGSHAASAESCNTLTFTISEKMALALGVSYVQSKTLLKISVKDGKNIHSTVKPTDLMRYLCRLITPQGGVILDPYMGSGSTGKAAMQEGNFSFIGIERDPDYFRIAETRINAAKVAITTKPVPQPDLFETTETTNHALG